MKAIILRAKPDGINREAQFLEGCISIGWPCGKDLTGENRSEIERALLGRYPDISAISVSMVDIFVHMPEGALVLTPSIRDKKLVHIFKTKTTCRYNLVKEISPEGNPHFILVKHLKTVSRKDLPMPVRKSLSGARKTLSSISQHHMLIEDFINNDFRRPEDEDSQVKGIRDEAIKVLCDLLASEDEHVRLQAAIALLGAE
ncbi:hypothetical protein [Desulfotalea psychrophila]|nr:hypothetical protein [Desulfotalea psychrophila]